jgi:transglutaminase-like putative cysteine protease/Fe2+ transport system protein FeoA
LAGLLTFRPLPRALQRPLSLLVFVAWALQMGVLLHHTWSAAPVALAADLSRYGSTAKWKGIYYRGEKIGFSVSQTLPKGDGYEIQEDGQLQLTLMGMGTPARLKTSVSVDRAFNMRAFSFSLDPGTGAINVDGTLDGTRLLLEIRTKGGKRSDSRELKESPNLSLNLSRRLAAMGLAPGKRFELSMFDPATLKNAPMTIEVEGRDVVRVGGRPLPTLKLRTQFSGVTSHSWLTETGEIVREESPMGLIVVQEPRETATAMAVSSEVRADMYDAAAIVPKPAQRIDDPASVEYLKLQLSGVDLEPLALQGAGQSRSGDVVELRDPESVPEAPPDAPLAELLRPEAFLESDAPEIVAEAKTALQGIDGARARAERLVRHVNALLEKRPTLSLPSALEVLRTRVGDCNEHTVLYVALARAAGIPARIAVGLVYLRGAFYYHAWPEVWIEGARGRGRFVAVDPTLNQFPADLTHVRLARGGLDKQAVILGLVGRAKIGILEVRMLPGTAPVLVGRNPATQAIAIDLPARDGSSGRTCWSKPRP